MAGRGDGNTILVAIGLFMAVSFFERPGPALFGGPFSLASK